MVISLYLCLLFHFSFTELPAPLEVVSDVCGMVDSLAQLTTALLQSTKECPCDAFPSFAYVAKGEQSPVKKIALWFMPNELSVYLPHRVYALKIEKIWYIAIVKQCSKLIFRQMTPFPFSVGDIVALKTHPYSPELTDVLISGDPLSQSPLLTVIEIVKEQDKSADSGAKGGTSPKFKCKCIWFSAKESRFVDKWVSYKFLKLILAARTKNSLILQEGEHVSLNTYSLESKKKKHSWQADTATIKNGAIQQTESTRDQITALLAFLPPIMMVGSVYENPSKERCLSKDKTEEIRRKAERVAKCLWFNGVDAKFSEVEIPLECLAVMPAAKIPTKDLIRLVNKNANAYFITKKSKRLLEFKAVRFAHGLYYLKGMDYVTNQLEEIELSNRYKVKRVDKPVIAYSPEFIPGETIQGSEADYFLAQMQEVIIMALAQCRYIRLHYINRKGKTSTRTLKDYEIAVLSRKDESGKDKNILLLQGYCFLKKELRTFRLERIEKVEVLNLQYSTPVTPSKGAGLVEAEVS